MRIENYTLPNHRRASLKAFLEDSFTGALKPAMIVVPGGSYLYKSRREADPVALSFLARNYQSFVLNYATLWDENFVQDGKSIVNNEKAPWPEQVEELLEAIGWLRRHAAEFNIDPGRIYCCGFSAGGHLCAAAGVFWHKVTLEAFEGYTHDDLRPDGLVLGYPLLTSGLIQRIMAAPNREMQMIGPFIIESIFGSMDVSEAQWESFDILHQVDHLMPPVFLWHTGDDEMTDPVETLQFTSSLLKHGIDCELHLFESGRHGAALANALSASMPEDIRQANAMWLELADLFLKNIEQEN